MHDWTCSWVPGTLNRVRVSDTLNTVETTLDRLVRVVGATILTDLYLKGRVTVLATDLDKRLAA